MCGLVTVHIIMMNNNLCSIILITLIYNDTCIWYHINGLKYNNHITAQLFSYFLLYMKPDTVSIIISGITSQNRTEQNRTIKQNGIFINMYNLYIVNHVHRTKHIHYKTYIINEFTLILNCSLTGSMKIFI